MNFSIREVNRDDNYFTTIFFFCEHDYASVVCVDMRVCIQCLCVMCVLTYFILHFLQILLRATHDHNIQTTPTKLDKIE